MSPFFPCQENQDRQAQLTIPAADGGHRGEAAVRQADFSGKQHDVCMEKRNYEGFRCIAAQSRRARYCSMEIMEEGNEFTEKFYNGGR